MKFEICKPSSPVAYISVPSASFTIFQTMFYAPLTFAYRNPREGKCHEVFVLFSENSIVMNM